MRLETFLLILGVLVFSEPFLGVPSSWKLILSTILGVLIAFLSVILRYRHRHTRVTDRTPVYVEQAPSPQPPLE